MDNICVSRAFGSDAEMPIEKEELGQLNTQPKKLEENPAPRPR